MNMAFQMILETLNAYQNPHDKGKRFEDFVLAFLRQGYYPERFRTVERWADWVVRQMPSESGKDRGIDFIAEDEEGRRWAIQAKHWDKPVAWSDLATFVAEAERPALRMDRLLVVALNDLTRDAWERCRERGIAVYTAEDFAAAPVQWDAFTWDKPAQLTRVIPREIRPYQHEALARIVTGWATHDRGKCIMPPGTGKTLVALRAAEAQAGLGGLVLFCAPSIALVNQTVLAWQRDATQPLRFVAVTSDTSVGRTDDADRTSALVVPPTTDAATLVRAAQPVPDALTVVVSTYQSLGVVAAAQDQGLPAFACAIADEAHRTTGISREEENPSGFLMFHDADRVRAAKRLYLTATPRVFTTELKETLKKQAALSYSMDDPHVFGPEFFRYPFWKAVDEGWLAPYQVVVLTFSERAVQQQFLSWLNEEDAPKVPELIRVEGLWKVLHSPGLTGTLRRVIAFVNSVKGSQTLAETFRERARRQPDADAPLTYAIDHIDGTMTMAERSRLLRRLEEPADGTGYVLTNARVLTEGIDVPALDAVVFLEPRKSQVDVIQAVGRVMRRPADRPDKIGYIVIPVVVDEGTSETLGAVEQVLLPQDQRFRPLIQIINALRSLDETLDVKIRHLMSHDGLPQKEDATIRFVFDPTMPPDLQEAVQRAIRPRLVDPVDNRHYFAAFADTITQVTGYLRTQLTETLAAGDTAASEAFATYHAALQEILHPGISVEDAQDFLVQHWILAPVFAALFPGDDLTTAPVAAAFEQVTAAFQAFLDRERQALDDFYARVRIRAEGIRSGAERQDFLRQLFEVLFKGAFPKAADRLGIVYTPVELVDFLIASIDTVLREHFGKTMADAGVTVIDPFAGTGTFPVRLIDRWDPDTIGRKIQARELWANDVSLFAYYLLLTNLRWTIRERTGHDPSLNLPVLWTDSFQLQEEQGTWRTTLFAGDYTALMTAQREAAITVVLGNPPWRTGQRDENEGNKNLKYDQLDKRIQSSYVVRSNAGLKRNLYDAYIRAFRWAADRIGPQGVVGFVTNAGWIDGNAMDGFRQVLAEEFAVIYVMNLRGNQRTQGELSRKEGGKIFGSGSRAAVALVVLIKDPAHTGPVDIFYHDIGDYLSREDKLARVAAFGDVTHVPWQRITPNAAGDWIQQRSQGFQTLMPLGDKKNGTAISIFTTYSLGIATNRDAWVYNFSYSAVKANMRRLIATYHQELGKPETMQANDPQQISWSRGLRRDATRGVLHHFRPEVFFMAQYRPFTKVWLYFDRAFNEMVYQQPRLFPYPDAENRVIGVQAPGDSRDFSCFIANSVPDLHLIGTSQCFPLYVYEAPNETARQADLFAEATLTRQSGIRSEAVTAFRQHYDDPRITADDVFYYVYGVLHAPDYRTQFANDLKKELPRIPFAPDFWAFSQAGRRLADIHLGYETIEPYPLDEHVAPNAPDDVALRYRVEKMQWGKGPNGKPDTTVIRYNDWITVTGIPPEALAYQVNGRSPVEWVMDQYRVKVDKDSGIVNDPNMWAIETADDPRYILDLLKRAVQVSLQTLAVVQALPPALESV